MKSPVALITGASRGIGRACAQALASAQSGHDIALHCFQNTTAAETVAAQLRALRPGPEGVRVEVFIADLSIAGQTQTLVESVATKMGPPTVLIHAAGSLIEKPLMFTSAEDFQRMLELHTISAALLSQALLRYIRKVDQGRIVLIGSLAGQIGLGNAAAYAASKGALNGLCKSLALEVARWNATVNLIAPGYVDTDMTASQTSEQRLALQENVPLGRFASAEEVGACAAFLCSKEAAYMTGQTLVLDGGLSLG